MPHFLVFSYDTFPAALKWQAVSFMRVEWPSIFAGANRLSAETYPDAKQPTHFAIVEDDILISYASMMQLQLAHAGAQYTVAAFGNVFTYPPFRGEGHGRRVVAGATHIIQRSACDIAILFCNPQLGSFYAQHGWTATPDAATRIGEPDTYTVDQDIRMMLWISERGQQARSAFSEQPLYIPWPW